MDTDGGAVGAARGRHAAKAHKAAHRRAIFCPAPIAHVYRHQPLRSVHGPGVGRRSGRRRLHGAEGIVAPSGRPRYRRRRRRYGDKRGLRCGCGCRRGVPPPAGTRCLSWCSTIRRCTPRARRHGNRRRGAAPPRRQCLRAGAAQRKCRRREDARERIAIARLTSGYGGKPARQTAPFPPPLAPRPVQAGCRLPARGR